MRYEDKGILVALQIIPQPVDMLNIEIVRRLIQDQDHGILQQQLREQHLCTLPARELIDPLFKADIPQAQSARNLFDARIEAVEAVRLQDALDITDVRHHPVHFLRRGLAHLVIAGQHLRLELVHVVKGRAQHLPDRLPGLQRRMLVEIADRHAVGPLDFSLIRRELTRNHREKRRFALAIRPDQCHMLAFQQPKGSILKNRPSAKAVGYMLYIQYTHLTPPFLIYEQYYNASVQDSATRNPATCRGGGHLFPSYIEPLCF